MPGKVRVIPAKTSEPMRCVVIYARVSSNSMEQLESLKAQISGLVGFVSGHNNWKLVDIHIDIASSKKGSAVACILDRDAGAFECPDCNERFVPDMKAYIMGPHTITKRKLVCPYCGVHKYCKKVLTK